MIGRELQSECLKEAVAKGEAQLIAVYGRRRVGKTYLVREVFGDIIANSRQANRPPPSGARIPNDAPVAASPRPTHHLKFAFPANRPPNRRLTQSRPLTPATTEAPKYRIENDVPVFGRQRSIRRTYLRGIVANSAVMPISWNALRSSSTHSDWDIFRHPSATFGMTQALKTCQRLFASCMSR